MFPVLPFSLEQRDDYCQTVWQVAPRNNLTKISFWGKGFYIFYLAHIHICTWLIDWLIDLFIYLLPAGCPEGSAAGIVFTHEVRCYFFGFFAHSGSTIDGIQKPMNVKCSHWPPLTSCKILFKSCNTRRCEATKCSLFLCNAYTIRRCR